MHLYISAEKENTYFIDTIKKYCANSHGRHTCIFFPHFPNLPREINSKIVQNIFQADLIFMDVTPRKVYTMVGKKKRTEWFTDHKIIFEYATAVALGKIEDTKVYCLGDTNNLHEFWRERTVDHYPLNDQEAFLDYLNEIISRREKDPNKKMRQSRINASFS